MASTSLPNNKPSSSSETETEARPTFPPPETFDIIPPLHGLLVRLIPPQTSTDESSALGNVRAQHSQLQQNLQSSLTTVTDIQSSQPISETDITIPPSTLDLKDLPTETNSIKIRIQKARVVVEALPDVHRTVAEQEEEIGELEDRVRRLREVIDDFGKRAKNAKDKS